MDPSRWQRVEDLYQAAAERKPQERAAFLAQACTGDEDLRREVESLLAQPSKDGPLDRPALELAVPLAIGQQVSHYQIQEKLGEGGMGVVYRAYDTQLRRLVALKILPPEFASDPERRSRLLREARAASALNHPNIVGIYEVGSDSGVDFIAMEFIEGKCLGDIIPARGLPLGKALDYAAQIAAGLAKAHAAGVVHRDLKPANIMLTGPASGHPGLVKLLDFGLARRVELAEGHDTTLTVQGEIAGTPAYMSPEQAQGKTVDARSDVFSFGSVLYRMVTGQPAFEKSSHISTLAAVVEQEPPPLPSGVSRDLARVIGRCLRKDPARRFQHIGDVKVELEDLKAELDQGSPPPVVPRRSRRKLWLAAAASVLLVSAAVLVWRPREGMPPGGLKSVTLTSNAGLVSAPSLSPDGNKVAFSWNGDKRDNYDIYVKQIGAPGPPLRLTTDPASDTRPAWSPDDRWIAFRRAQPGGVGAIMLISPLGGPERKLAEILDFSQEFSWTPDAKWLAFASLDSLEGKSSIWAINVDTAERRRLTTFVTRSAGSDYPLGDFCPSISPDGSALAFGRQVRHWVYELYVQRLTRDLRPQGEPALVTDRRYGTLAGIAWTANSREIVYGTGGGQNWSLWRVPVSGGRAPEHLNYAQPGAIQPAIAGSPPRLVYNWSLANINLWRLDVRTGERKMLIGSTYTQSMPQYSPDGRKIAFGSTRSGGGEIWTCDADGSNCLQITSCDGPQCGNTGAPRWSPDSRSLSFDSAENGQPEIYVVAADGGKPRRLTYSHSNDIEPSWSHDGLWVYFTSDRSGQYEVWKVPKDGGEAVQVTRSGGYTSSESPDGRYIYYTKFSRPFFYEVGLFRMPAQGGQETQILQGPVGIIFGVTSKGVYFHPNARTIRLFDTASGKTSTIAELDKAISIGLCVSADDAYLMWDQTDRSSSDLMLVEGFR